MRLRSLSKVPVACIRHSRRRFLAGASAAALSGLTGRLSPLHAEPPPEISTVRLGKVAGICVAPQYVAEELLRAEGFTDVRYVETGPGLPNIESIARGEIDFTLNFVAPCIVGMDAGLAITLLAGVHPGCFELFGNNSIQSIGDLRGKSVGVQALGGSHHLFIAAMATYVGLDPLTDINWIASPTVRPMQLFIDGKIDAFLGFPPEPQELRGLNVGHVVVNSALDRPWSQYLCCYLVGNTGFVRDNPIATERVLRAILKSADLCAADPERVARQIVEDGFTQRYAFALQALQEVPYGQWRNYDAEDTVRFYALRLREAGMITSSPQDIIGQHTNWRMLDELKRELKA